MYFGYPQAHEDDAERAVRAGLEILDALARLNDALEPEHGVRLAARVGIHTGPVVIGAMGSGAKSETLALGETTNIAARLEAVAAPGTVVISGATLRLVPGMFVLAGSRHPAAQGRRHADPRLRRAAGRPACAAASTWTPSTPHSARRPRAGARAADRRWEQAQERDGQAVLIAGEAGIGKSRLLQAFRERLAETPHTWLECRCSPYTQGSAFHPVIELVEQGLGFRSDDDARGQAAPARGGDRGTRALERADAVPLLAALLSLPLPEPLPAARGAPSCSAADPGGAGRVDCCARRSGSRWCCSSRICTGATPRRWSSWGC